MQFVSTVESKEHPIYATQLHPEKNPFEVKMVGGKDDLFYEAINHDSNAVVGAFNVANFFVNECRKSTHRYHSAEALMDALIYNYPLKYYSTTVTSFIEKYVFEF